jgi:transposase InsO family protein
MSSITQKAKFRQGVVKLSIRKGKSFAAIKYGVSLSSVKRWCKRYDGSWQSLVERSHKPKKHPAQHKPHEEKLIKEAFKTVFLRYGWDGVFGEAQKAGYTRSYSGMVYAAKRMGLGYPVKPVKMPRKFRKFPEQQNPGDKVQIDVKVVPYYCLKGDAKRDERRLYQWTAIDECTRFRFVYAFDSHTAENSVKFLRMLRRAFPFRIKTIQTDNGTEFTNKFTSETKENLFEIALKATNIHHKLIRVRTPWHNGKVERSHRGDQRYFYDWERFGSLTELNEKLKKHLELTNNKRMCVIGGISPAEKLRFKQNEAVRRLSNLLLASGSSEI